MRSLRLGRRQSIASLLAIRFLLIANGSILTALGVLYLVYAAPPAGLVVGSVLLAAAAGLFGCVPLTDPYRRRR